MPASMFEIYNEIIHYLFPLSRCGSCYRISSSKQFTIKHDATRNTHLSGLTVVDVCSINEVSSLFKQATQRMSVGKTQMNEQSSRCHFVFTLLVSRVNDVSKEQGQGILNIFDLAGSECLAQSGATGDRLKETQVITLLLKHFLDGDSRTLMFVNISLEVSSASESIYSLRFAARAMHAELEYHIATQAKLLDSRLRYG
ncbi:Kinesin-5 [Platanthera guangdongensis]|uniref:Kinesin-5 n=1 Tax=Platanthera guangdongensis TaxID=2320717 RepID=A0ABR2MAS2_9ASPA